MGRARNVSKVDGNYSQLLSVVNLVCKKILIAPDFHYVAKAELEMLLSEVISEVE